MTIMMNTGDLPSSSFTNQIEFSKADLQSFVDAGLIWKLDRQKEHFAVQPCWIHDPGKGVMEQINNYMLGRWNKRLQGYVVHVDNIRNADNSAGLNEDHRWLHVDIFATFYVYKPEVGQTLRGEIKKVGSKAAICIVFDVFTATVFAVDSTELSNWNIGQEIDFEISSFQDRRQGPILQGKSIRNSGFNGSRKRKRSYTEVPQDENGAEPQINSHTDEPSTSKKKKKRRKNQEEPCIESTSSVHNNSATDGNCLIKVEDDETEIHVKKKKKKKKSSSMDD